MTIQLTEEHLLAIGRHGSESYRDEACGAIFGHAHDDQSKSVVEVSPLPNARDEQRHRRFLVTPEIYRNAEAEADGRGLTLVGFYHSHPDHPAFPSDYDLNHAFPFFSYIIVSVRSAEPQEVRSFVLATDRSQFIEEEISTIDKES